MKLFCIDICNKKKYIDVLYIYMTKVLERGWAGKRQLCALFSSRKLLNFSNLFALIYRDACKSILNFLSDVFDLANSSAGEVYRPVINDIIVPRGATLTRILIASLAGALPSSRLEEV